MNRSSQHLTLENATKVAFSENSFLPRSKNILFKVNPYDLWMVMAYADLNGRLVLYCGFPLQFAQ